MPRIVSVWLPRWPILRFLASEAKNNSPEPVDPAAPFVLTEEGRRGLGVAAVNAAAERLGIVIGESLSDVRSRTGIKQIRAGDPAADAAALRRLALWATRYSPSVALFGEERGADGLFIDIDGAAHLFGGEENLLADLAQRLQGFGLPARLAAAGTPGAAWALSRFSNKVRIALSPGQEAAALADLPIAALRLPPEIRASLRRLGFKRIGSLADAPRSLLGPRFETELMTRLDQTLGKTAEPLVFISPAPVYRRIRHLMEPVFTQEAVIETARELVTALAFELERDGAGIRALRVALYRVDGDASEIGVALSKPSRSVSHIERLLNLKIERLGALEDAAFGFDTIGICVSDAEPMTPRQSELTPEDEASRNEHLAALTDRLRQRLGAESVRWLAPLASHIPERAETISPTPPAPWPAPHAAKLRPQFLLPRAEAAEVVALVPEGPPKRFRWRGRAHGVRHAQGPERIAGEWWKDASPARDYYIIEDDKGRRFWLYREGLYEGETANPRWFVHGFFA